MLQAKFSVAPGSPVSAATAVAMVVHAAQTAAGSLHVYASSIYPGCLEVVLLAAAGTHVSITAAVEAAFAAALAQQLRQVAPASHLLLSAVMELVGRGVPVQLLHPGGAGGGAPSQLLQPGLAGGGAPAQHPGVWCEPVLSAGSGSQALTLRLPLHLVQRLAAQGRALRVVATVDAQAAPVMDALLRPGDAGWPASGQLHVSVTLPSEPQLLVVHLLSQQLGPAVCEKGMVDQALLALAGSPRLPTQRLATLPVLLVPAAVCAEVQQLFRTMQQEVAAGGQLPGGGQDSSAAAALAYQRHMSVFVLDCAVLLRQGPSACQPVARAVLHLLASQGMAAATQLLRAAFTEQPLVPAPAGPPAATQCAAKPGAGATRWLRA